jgi:hypothetical protein
VIGHDARLAGNTVTAEGRVERNLDIGAETARIGANIGSTVSARADHVFVSYRTGDWLVERLHRMQTSLWMRMILGVLVISFAMSLPTIGLIVTAIVMVLGAGALVLERRSQRMHAHTIA